MYYFRQFVNITQLLDVHLEGTSFTWLNRKLDGKLIQRKLEKAMVISEWRNHFTIEKLIAVHTSSSNHKPLVLQLNKEQRREIPFRFEKMWILFFLVSIFCSLLVILYFHISLSLEST